MIARLFALPNISHSPSIANTISTPKYISHPPQHNTAHYDILPQHNRTLHHPNISSHLTQTNFQRTIKN